MIKILGPNDPALEALKISVEQNKGLNCELTIVAWEAYRAKLDETLSASTPEYDAVCIPGHIWLPQLANDGLLKDFDSLFSMVPTKIQEHYNSDDIFPSIQKECKFVGADGKPKQYVLPLFTDGHIVFYRSDLVNLPETIDPREWHKHLDGLNLPNGIMPFAMKAHNSEIFLDVLPYLWAFGGDLWDGASSVPVFNSEANANAIEYYTSLRKYCPADTHNYGNGEILDAINTGKVAIVTSWGGQAAGIFDPKNNQMSQHIKTAALSNAWNATWGVSIPANISAPKAAETLSALMQLMDATGDKLVTEIAGSPVRLSSYTKAEKDKFPWLASQQALLENCQILPVDPAFGNYLGGLYGEVYNAFVGTKTAKEALSDAIGK